MNERPSRMLIVTEEQNFGTKARFSNKGKHLAEKNEQRINTQNFGGGGTEPLMRGKYPVKQTD